MFTLAMVVIFGVAGGVVDISRAFNIRNKLQMAADSAVLAAANDPSISERQAKQEARRYFNAGVADLPSSVKPSFDVKRVKTVARLDVTASTSAEVPTTMLGVMGFKKIVISATATAGRNFTPVEIHAALDMSASMGIAADDANRLKLVNLTKPLTPDGLGCAFACHQPSNDVLVATTAYDFAKQNGVKLREDVMLDAFGVFVDEVLNPNDPEVKAGQRRIATYGFSNSLLKLQDLNSTSAVVKGSVKTFPSSERKSTHHPVIMDSLSKELGFSNASVAGSPRKILLLVTDGVRWDNWPVSPAYGAFDSKWCEAVKKNGVDVAVLEIKYYEDTSDYWFSTYVKPYYNQISPNLLACASPGLYFKVADSAEAQLKQAFAEVGRAMKGKLSLSR